MRSKMAIFTNHGIGVYIYIYVVVILNCMLACYTSIPVIHPGTILKASHSHCLVLFPDETENDATEHIIKHLTDVSFANETNVLFGRIQEVPFIWPNGVPFKVSGSPSIEELQRSLLLVQQYKTDRSCLFETENTFTAPFIIHHNIFYDDLSNVNTIHVQLVNFINLHCRTFRHHDGSLNMAGLHRKSILENLYSTRAPIDHDKETLRYCSKSSAEGQHFNDLCKTDDIVVEKTHSTVAAEHEFSDISSGRIEECDKIEVPTSSEFFHEYLSRSKPVIITGATKHWRAFNKWKNEYMKRKYGAQNVHIKLTPDGHYEGVEPIYLWEGYQNFKVPKSVQEKLPYPDLVVVRPASKEILFADFLDLIEKVSSGNVKNISAYLEYSSIADYFPELRNDITEMKFLQNILVLKHLNIWLSDGNTLGKLHFDPFDNFLCQISGEKQVLMFEPHENTHLYEGHIQESQLSYNSSENAFYRRKLLDSTSMVMSPVDPLKPDLQRFPKFAHVKPLNCTIKAGDVLYMPSFWWHEVQSRPSISEHRNLAVNFWYEPFLTREFPCPECKLDVNSEYFHLL